MASEKSPVVFSTSLPPTDHDDHHGTILNFTATGRPFNPNKAKHGSGLSSLNSGESMGIDGAPNLLPRRYTDDSKISIPVLPASALNSNTSPPTSPTSTWSDLSTAPINANPVQYDSNKPSLKFWKSRKPSTSSHARKQSKGNADFEMKFVTRGDYLKYYAKDEEGRYIGTEDPAEDCILKHESDLIKYRRGRTAWKNEIEKI